MAKVKDLKKGDYFTKKEIPFPNDNQVWVRDEYCREEKKYICYKFSDIGTSCLMSGTKEVYSYDDGMTF